jgi:CBS domain-containing protein
MQVKDAMTRGAECVRPDTTVQEAARKMRDMDIGPLPVCGENDRLLGMLTDRDITVRSVADGRDPTRTPVRDVMTEGVSYCYEDEDLTEAARQMGEKQIRRLVVLNRDKQLVGIVSLGDMAVSTGGDRKVSGKTLEAVSEPSVPNR